MIKIIEEVSVIIPTYNRANVIERAINSVLSQSYKCFEVIVVDDNSTDETKAVLEKYSNQIRYIRNPVNVGPAKARNIGVALAKGSLVAFQDSDDEWYPNKIEEQVKYLRENKECGMVYCAYERIEEYYNVRVPAATTPLFELKGRIFDSLIEDNKVGTPTMLIRSEVFKRVGFFSEELRALEDWELALRISLNFEVGFVEKTLVNVFPTLDGVNSIIDNKLEAMIFVARKYFKYVKNRERISASIYELVCLIESRNNNIKSMYRRKLIPEVISSDIEYDAIKIAVRKKEKFRQNYEMALKLVDLCLEPDLLIETLQKLECNEVIILGFGKIGRRLFHIMVKKGFRIKFVIDQNEGRYQDVQIINSKNIMDQTGIIINTIPDFENSTDSDFLNRNKFVITKLYDNLNEGG